MPEEKICPLMSAKDAPVFCTPQCKLYRDKADGYQCMLSEMQAISWNTKAPRANNNTNQYPPG
jgi:hypothetical protein